VRGRILHYLAGRNDRVENEKNCIFVRDFAWRGDSAGSKIKLAERDHVEPKQIEKHIVKNGAGLRKL
jgi:hypothetical protein